MYWLEVSVVTDGEGAEAVAEKLRPFAYQDGVVLEQLGDVSSAEPDALETAVTVKIYIPEDEDSPRLRRRIEEVLYFLGRLYPIPPPTFRQLAEEDWANAWKAHYHPFRIGRRIWIQPSWLEAAADDAAGMQPGDVVLTLDPGMAFGTGLHPTTQMCLQALETVVTPGCSVLDVGTGSGILAIAAAKLGAASLLAVDVDAQAVKTAVANAGLNQVRQLEVRQGTLRETVGERPWDVAVVNILAPVIAALLAEDQLLHYVSPQGYLILSGIIDEQAPMVETAVNEANGQICQTLWVGDWVTYIVKRK